MPSLQHFRKLNHRKLRALVIADFSPEIDIPEVVKDESIDIVITLGDLLR